MGLTTTLRTQGAGYSATTLFDALDDLLIDQSDQVSSTGSTQTLSSGTYTVLTDMTLTLTIESNHKVLVMWSFNLSGNTAGDDFRFAIHENGSEIAASALYYWPDNEITSTAGLIDCYSGQYLFESPSTGSVTYDLRGKRNSGSGNCYINLRRLTAIAFRAS